MKLQLTTTSGLSTRMTVSICSVLFAMSALTETPLESLSRQDLAFNSRFCAENQKLVSRQCFKSVAAENLEDAYEILTVVQKTATAAQIKENLFPKTKKALLQQIAAAKWLGGEDLLDTAQIGKAIDQMKSRCSEASPTQKKGYRAWAAQLTEQARNLDTQKELGLEALSESAMSLGADFLRKRYILASYEYSRLAMSSIDQAARIGEENVAKMKVRMAKIKQAYPMIESSFRLNQAVKLHYQIYGRRSHAVHSELDKVLFPHQDDGTGELQFESLPFQLPENQEAPNPLLASQKIIENPIPKEVLIHLKKSLRRTIENSIKSIGEFCQADACTTMNISHSETMSIVKKTSEKKRRNLVLAGVCRCGLNNRRVVFSGTQELVVGAATVGFLLLCPFSFGIGCVGAGFTGAGLVGMGAFNMYGAGQDLKEVNALKKVIMALPGVSEVERQRVRKAEIDASGRLIMNASTTALGAPVVSLVPKAGQYTFKLVQEFADWSQSFGRTLLRGAPPRRSFVPVFRGSLSDLEKDIDLARVALDKMGVDFVVHTGKVPSRISRIHRTKERLGQIFKVNKPAASGPESAFTPTLQHPKIVEYMKELEEMGFDLVVDTSLKRTNVGAYVYHPEKGAKVLGISEDTPWYLFKHEFQHVEFYRTVSKHLDNVRVQVSEAGKNLKEVAPEMAEKLGPRRTRRLETLLRRQLPDTAINESMAVDEELLSMGFKRFIADRGIYARRYALGYQIDGLRALPFRTAVQNRELHRAVGARLLLGASRSIGASTTVLLDANYRKVFYTEDGELIGVLGNGQLQYIRPESDQ